MSESKVWDPTRAGGLIGDDGRSASPVGSLAALAAVAGASRPTSLLPFGDSIVNEQFGSYASGTNNTTTARGSLHHFNALIGGPFRVIGNAGVSGTTTIGVASNPFDVNGTQNWLARIDAAIALRPDVMFVGYPQNDQVLGVEAADTIAALTTIHNKIRAAGILIIQATSIADVRTVSANSLAGNSAAKMRGHFSTVMAWIKESARRGKFLLYEQYAPTSNPSTGALVSNYTYDSLIHPAARGAGAIAGYNAATLGATLRAMLPAFELTGYPNWQGRIGNAFLTGTGGSNTQSYTGNIPDSFTTYKVGTPTSPTVATVARTDGKQGSYIGITATATADGDRVGFFTSIGLSAAWSTGAKTKYTTIRGSYGDHWMCTTAGTSSGSEPAAMAAASTLGQEVTDSGGVVWTRVTTLNPGDQFEVVMVFQIIGASSLTLGAQPMLFVNVNGTGASGGGRALDPNAADKLATCYAQTSATPALQDRVLRTVPLTFNSSTTSIDVYAAMILENTMQATLAIAGFAFEKVQSI